MERRTRGLLASAIAVTLAACGGGSGDGGGASPPSGATGTPDAGGTPTDGTGGTPDATPPLIEGDIARYGVVAVGDEAGEASDAVAGFFALSASVAPAAFGGALMGGEADCRVQSDDADAGFENVSVTFVPNPDAVSERSVAAGETVMLTSPAGTWAELERGSAAGAYTFYSLPTMQMLPDGAVPDGLVVDVADGGDFPGFANVAMPDVETLTAVDYGGGDTITRDTRFTWQTSATAGTRIRLLTATNAGFFADDGLRVSCLVPDSGEFVFPADVRARLGADFVGTPPSLSRVAIGTEQQGDALLILVRESFAP